MNINLIHHVDPESKGLLREMNRKLNHITERLNTMATEAQVTQLKSHVEALISAYQQALAAANKPPAPPADDPVLDELDAKVQAALAPPAAAEPAPAPVAPEVPAS